MSDAADFTKLVPGFEFLKNLVSNAGSTLPSVGQWVAPTLDADEIDKRIGELRTVQFWLEQNARMLGATIQALEVQRMTLSTLKNMNVQMTDLRDALTIRLPEAPVPAPAPAPAPAVAPAAPPPGPRKTRRAAAPATDGGGDTGGAPSGGVDPMQWWGALTRQFTEIATKALQDGGAAAAAVAPAMGAAAPGPSVPAPASPAAPRTARSAKPPSAAARQRRPSRQG